MHISGRQLHKQLQMQINYFGFKTGTNSLQQQKVCDICSHYHISSMFQSCKSLGSGLLPRQFETHGKQNIYGELRNRCFGKREIKCNWNAYLETLPKIWWIKKNSQKLVAGSFPVLYCIKKKKYYSLLILQQKYKKKDVKLVLCQFISLS